jgi:hypothetical protein
MAEQSETAFATGSKMRRGAPLRRERQNRRLETVDWRPSTGDRRLETVDWRPSTDAGCGPGGLDRQFRGFP